MTEVAGGKHELISTHAFIDSATCTDHTTNPHDYTFDFERTLYHIQAVHLRDLYVKVTPVFAIVRTSKWITSGQDTIASQTDTTKALFDAGTYTEHARIYDNNELVDLTVHYCFNERITRGNGDYRDFSCFICTGTVDTTSTDLWYFTDPSTVVTMTDASGGTSDDAATPSGTALTSFITVTRMYTQAFLRLTIGSYMLDRHVFEKTPDPPRWRSYWIYEPGDVVQVSDGTRYRCQITHCSLIFATDLSFKKWGVTTEDVQFPANTFHAIESTSSNEAYFTLNCKPDDISWFNTEHAHLHACKLRVEWINRWNRKYRFVANGNVEITAYPTTATETSVREFDRHWFSLEIRHYGQGVRAF